VTATHLSLNISKFVGDSVCSFSFFGHSDQLFVGQKLLTGSVRYSTLTPGFKMLTHS